MLIEGNPADLPGLDLPSNSQDFVENLPNDLIEILNKIATEGGGVWLVGGCVRDSMLGQKVKDFDIAVDFSPTEMMRIFPDAIPTGLDFGCVTLRGSKQNYEATTLRSESGYSDGRRPDQVELVSSLSKDLERRDFTINAMAIDVARKFLHDPHNGRLDLKKGVIKSVGIPTQRINEDGLRILRAYRFMDRGEIGLWPMNQDLSIAIRNQSEILNKISSERINVEFSKIIAGKHCSQIVEKMLNDGVLPIFSPLDPINCYTAVRGLNSPDTLKLSTEARISMLFSNLDQDKLSKFLRDMKTSNEFRKKCLLLHSLIGTMPDSTIESSRVHKHILGPNGFEHLIIQKIISEYNIQTLSSSEIDSNEVLSAIERYHSIPSKVALPLLDGEYLMRTTGIPSGKKLGCLKDWLFRLQVERSITSFEKMESLLCSLPWTADNFEQWPKMIFPEK